MACSLNTVITSSVVCYHRPSEHPLTQLKALKKHYPQTALTSHGKDRSPVRHLVFPAGQSRSSLSLCIGTCYPQEDTSDPRSLGVLRAVPAQVRCGTVGDQGTFSHLLVLISRWFLTLNSCPVTFSHLSGKREGL